VAKTDTLPRMTDGQFANVNRREQKIQLAHTLFTEDDADDVHNNSTASEVYVEKKMDEEEDEETKKMLYERLRAAKFALKLSTVMREPACAALSLAEISKRYLNCYGKAGAEVRRRSILFYKPAQRIQTRQSSHSKIFFFFLSLL
jgi:hypothetical protein